MSLRYTRTWRELETLHLWVIRETRIVGLCFLVVNEYIISIMGELRKNKRREQRNEVDTPQS
jgi:hypothetical protein